MKGTSPRRSGRVEVASSVDAPAVCVVIGRAAGWFVLEGRAGYGQEDCEEKGTKL